MTTSHVPERRRRDVVGRIARATFPARFVLRESVSDFIAGFPCNVIGHRWLEVPSSHLSARARTAHRMRFKCSRCFLTAGFSN